MWREFVQWWAPVCQGPLLQRGSEHGGTRQCQGVWPRREVSAAPSKAVSSLQGISAQKFGEVGLCDVGGLLHPLGEAPCEGSRHGLVPAEPGERRVPCTAARG